FGRVGPWPMWGPCTWYVFPSGLGVSDPVYGRAFMPVEHILRLEKGYFLGGAKLIHNSPEFRSRVILPISWVTKAVESILAARHARADAG
ncbi:MAG: hypothetical protein QGH74_03145, partial [Candidatus Brocadiia bacterium]|nr:hypothetical protein [Candidatus Brocadiia bacterium]